eukprot:CAMPEP_0204121406 /NCGR_PEP_ID=MMETSP0361-20130328/8183_1 /ASSEMBLY_ACC=CAM_ASM_000343 /TAXON_ID=268821 /ORGANISM="Scrippsiella Hangoei, Strain SHTV-5" /LENGTH=350 /DNA_ID=CAMNT_0051072703 /DNA_START=219 /DNA_END=1274 /DNA_ORIENTATION=+
MLALAMSTFATVHISRMALPCPRGFTAKSVFSYSSSSSSPTNRPRHPQARWSHRTKPSTAEGRVSASKDIPSPTLLTGASISSWALGDDPDGPSLVQVLAPGQLQSHHCARQGLGAPRALPPPAVLQRGPSHPLALPPQLALPHSIQQDRSSLQAATEKLLRMSPAQEHHLGDLLCVATSKKTPSPMKGKPPDPETDEGVVHCIHGLMPLKLHLDVISMSLATELKGSKRSLAPTPVQPDCGPHHAHLLHMTRLVGQHDTHDPCPSALRATAAARKADLHLTMDCFGAIELIAQHSLVTTLIHQDRVTRLVHVLLVVLPPGVSGCAPEDSQSMRLPTPHHCHSQSPRLRR